VRSTADPAPAAPDRPIAWWRATWALALCGCALYWAVLPPLALAPLAWLAPVPWVLLIRASAPTGKRPYVVLWCAGFSFWMAALYWLTLPHWATSFGWVALSCYLAFYLPVFVGLARVAVHRLGISSVLAAPVVWTGLELARAHLLSGFTMASPGHTQYRWPALAQISDLVGNYGVSFLIVLVAASLARMLPWDGARRAWWPLVPAAAAVAATLVYGHWRLTEQASRPGPKIALIQGSIDIEMKHDPEQAQRIFDEYYDLSRSAVKQHRDLDLIVWPETMFRYPWYTFDDDYKPPAGSLSPQEATERSRRAIANIVESLGTPVLLGVDTVHGTGDRLVRYNSALFTDRAGKVIGRYDKCHLVMFGEYVPLARWFPWLYRLTPLAGGLESGAGPRSATIGNTRYAANICYEDTLPHLVRRQILELRSQNGEPDVLVNLTNDGWFWGSSELDMHLASAMFRAIECRKPLVIAANTGFSAWIDSCGRIVAQGPRRDAEVIIAQPALDGRGSFYLDNGDVAAGACLVAVMGLAIVGLAGWWRRPANCP
jgi:apolipoprotein N-acyltransferase